MPILDISYLQVGSVGTVPSLVYVNTNDTVAEILETGYLNKAVANGAQLTETSMCLVATKTSPSAASTQIGWYDVTYNKSTRDWSFASTGEPGSVVLPTIANHLAVYTNATGELSEDAATAINGGNLQAGLSGTAGYLASFPATAAKGSFRFVAADNVGNTVTQITNAPQAAARIYTVPDANANSEFLMTNSSGTQTIATGNLSLTVGNLEVAAGNLDVTLGSISAGQVIQGANGILITSGDATIDGNIVSNQGYIQALEGDVLAGSPGHLGQLIAYPSNNAAGRFILAPVNLGGDYDIILTYTALGQATTYTLAPVGLAAADVIVKTASLVVDNLVATDVADGVVKDSGIAITAVQLNTDVKAAQTANIGGAGAGPINVAVTGLTGASVVVASILSSSNTVAVAKVDPDTDSFDITFTGDPGASCIVSYVAYIAAQ